MDAKTPGSLDAELARVANDPAIDPDIRAWALGLLNGDSATGVYHPDGSQTVTITRRGQLPVVVQLANRKKPAAE